MKSLAELKNSEKGRIIKLEGGQNFIERLETLGIREGVTIEKKNSQWLNGPVCIKIGNTEAAIGYGMAKKILIEQEKHK